MLSATASRSRSFDQSIKDARLLAGRSPSLPSLAAAVDALAAQQAAPAPVAPPSVDESMDGYSSSSPEDFHASIGRGSEFSTAGAIDSWHRSTLPSPLAPPTDRIGSLNLDGHAVTFATVDRPGGSVVDDKPYRCQVPGCQKAYKNANGLKYHAFHGHADENQTISKPHKCPYPGCIKAYKNANGLKYHVAHGHVVGGVPPMVAGLPLDSVLVGSPPSPSDLDL